MYITPMRSLFLIVLLTLSLQACEVTDSDPPETPMDQLVPPVKKRELQHGQIVPS
jgi:hypothetical protein